MDISTVSKKLEGGEYRSHLEFEKDMNLIFQNCYLFNQPGDRIYQMGERFEALFRALWAKLPPPGSSQMELSPSCLRGWLKRFTPKAEPGSRTKRARSMRPKHSTAKKRTRASSDGSYKNSGTDDDRIEMLEQTLYMVSRDLLELKNERGARVDDADHKPPWAGSSRARRKRESRRAEGDPAETGSRDDSTTGSPPRRLSREEKGQLHRVLQNLDEDETVEVFKIIEDRIPALRDAVESVGGEAVLEVDLERLDDATCSELHRLLLLGVRPRRRKPSDGDGRVRNGARLTSRVGKQRMTAEEEARLIDALTAEAEHLQSSERSRNSTHRGSGSLYRRFGVPPSRVAPPGGGIVKVTD